MSRANHDTTSPTLSLEGVGKLVATYFAAKDALDDAQRPESGWARPKALPYSDPRVVAYNAAAAALREFGKRHEPVIWTVEDQKAAEVEGWSLFNHPHAPEIQRDDEAAVFESDEAAIQFVLRLANAGRPYAQRAFALHCSTVPEDRRRR
jgi:hypothetical protein